MRAYYDDSYTHEFSAQIVERGVTDGRPWVVLDRTYFYPTGGGQPHDTGRIGGVTVIDVQTRREDHAVLHLLEGEVSGDRAACVIDWGRRFDHMQHHTGQHILSQAFVRIADASTVGFHLSPDSVTIDLDRFDLDESRLHAVEDLANGVIVEDRPITTRLLPPDSPEMAGVRMRGVPETRATEGLRVVDIGGFDRTACGGTHTARTGEVGLIKIVRAEKKGDKLRIEFRCGGRALRDYRERVRVTALLTADLTCALPEIPDSVARLRDDLKTTTRLLREAQAALMGYERDALLASAADASGARLVIAAYDDRDSAAIRALAGLLIEQPGTIALLGCAGAKAGFVLARSADQRHDMNALFRALVREYGEMRGGGQPNMAQGGGGALDRDGVLRVLTRARELLSG